MSYAVKPVPDAKGPAVEGNNPLAMISLILGLVGIVTGGCPFSIGATITGWMGMQREPVGTAKLGFWLGVSGMIFQMFLGMFILVSFGLGLGLGLTSVETTPGPLTAPMVVEGAPAVAEPAPALEAESIPPSAGEVPATAP
jgi:hypothetical protein